MDSSAEVSLNVDLVSRVFLDADFFAGVFFVVESLPEVFLDGKSFARVFFPVDFVSKMFLASFSGDVLDVDSFFGVFFPDESFSGGFFDPESFSGVFLPDFSDVFFGDSFLPLDLLSVSSWSEVLDLLRFSRFLPRLSLSLLPSE